MRIAYVNQDPGIDPERHKGAAVHLLAMREALRALGAEVACFDEPRATTLSAALEQAHGAAAFDLVYERYSLGALEGSRRAAAWGVPHVLEVNSPLTDEEQRWRPSRGERFAEAEDPSNAREVFARARKVIAVSSQVARYAYEQGARSGTVKIFPNGVDTSRFRPRGPGDRMRRRLVPEGRVALGFHGRLRPWHGFDAIVAAAAELLQGEFSIHLVVVGEGPYEEALAGRLPGEHVTRLDWLPHEEVAAVVASFDLLPLAYGSDLPCYFSPLKLAEAMAAGVVPVVPRLGDLPRIVQDGWNGIVFDPENERGLVEALGALVQDGERRALLARRARAAAEGLGWNRIAHFVIEEVGTIRPSAGTRR